MQRLHQLSHCEEQRTTTPRRPYIRDLHTRLAWLFTLEINGKCRFVDINLRNGKVLLLANVDLGLLKEGRGSLDFVSEKSSIRTTYSSKL